MRGQMAGVIGGVLGVAGGPSSTRPMVIASTRISSACCTVIPRLFATSAFVNHGFGHGQKGAIGILVVEGPTI